MRPAPTQLVAAAARDSFVLAHQILGNLIGETFGYLLTAAWTLLVVVALRRNLAGLWFSLLGTMSAVLIVSGALSPLNLPLIDDANFIGYVLWSVWLVIFAILLLRGRPRPGTTSVTVVTLAARHIEEHSMTRTPRHVIFGTGAIGISSRNPSSWTAARSPNPRRRSHTHRAGPGRHP